MNKLTIVTAVAVIAATFLAFLPSYALASANGRNVARMNAGIGGSVTANGVQQIVRVANARPGLSAMLDEGLGSGWRDNMRVTGVSLLGENTQFINSGLDRNGNPVQWRQSAGRDNVKIVFVVNLATGREILIKDDCINPVNPVNGFPLVPYSLVETSSITNVTFDLNLVLNVHNEAEATATANARVDNNVRTGDTIINFFSGRQEYIVRGANPNTYTRGVSAQLVANVGLALGRQPKGPTAIAVSGSSSSSSSSAETGPIEISIIRS